MKPIRGRGKRQQGASLIEVLVTLVILMLGLLGLVGLMLHSQRSQQESYQRVQALVLLEDMANRIRTNRKAAPCYVFTTTGSGTPFLGTGATAVPACATGTVEQQARAINDMNEWSDLLAGNSEMLGANPVGAMLGARGCVELAAPDVYRVSVVWQGNSETFPPAAEVSCASGQYGTEPHRRAVSVNLQIAKLS